MTKLLIIAAIAGGAYYLLKRAPSAVGDTSALAVAQALETSDQVTNPDVEVTVPSWQRTTGIDGGIGIFTGGRKKP